MSLNIDIQALQRATPSELQAFHLEDQLPQLAANLSAGDTVVYNGRLITKNSAELSKIPADTLELPTSKELDVVINKVHQLRASPGFKPTGEFEKSLNVVRKYANQSRPTEGTRILDHETKSAIAIQTTFAGRFFTSISQVIGRMFQ